MNFFVMIIVLLLMVNGVLLVIPIMMDENR